MKMNKYQKNLFYIIKTFRNKLNKIHNIKFKTKKRNNTKQMVNTWINHNFLWVYLEIN